MDESTVSIVRQVVTELLSDNEYIKYNDVREHTKIKNLQVGDNSLRSIIHGFVQDGFIIEKQKASGRRPALYSIGASYRSTVDIKSQSDDLTLNTRDIIPEDIESNDKPRILKQFTLKICEIKREIREIESQEREINGKIEDLERERSFLRKEKQILEKSQSNLQELLEFCINELKVNKPELENSQAITEREFKGGEESNSDN
jgi:hypothetical protein